MFWKAEQTCPSIFSKHFLTQRRPKIAQFYSQGYLKSEHQALFKFYIAHSVVACSPVYSTGLLLQIVEKCLDNADRHNSAHRIKKQSKNGHESPYYAFYQDASRMVQRQLQAMHSADRIELPSFCNRLQEWCKKHRMQRIIPCTTPFNTDQYDTL